MNPFLRPFNRILVGHLPEDPHHQDAGQQGDECQRPEWVQAAERQEKHAEQTGEDSIDEMDEPRHLLLYLYARVNAVLYTPL